MIQGKTCGEGIKKTPAYETPLSKHDLIKWRQEFWETRTSGHRHIWTLLKNACSEDHETANALILAAGLQMPQNSLTLVIDEGGWTCGKDGQGVPVSQGMPTVKVSRLSVGGRAG